jgi:hypothetical protein
MKKYLLAVLLLASFQSFGQFLNYTNINGRYKWIAGKFDSTFTIPSGTTPSLRVGGGTGPGALFYRTTDSTVYQYTGTQWIKLRAGVSPTDTAGIWISNVYRQTGTDSVFYVKGGTSTFAFRDSIGNVGGGGGGGKIYYFNGGVNLGTFAGLTMYELGDTAVTSAAANFTRSTTGNLANFITDVNRPGLLQIPAGVWTVDAYLSETGGGSNHAQIWIEVEKWNGSTITTIATSPIEEITNGNVIDLYTWSVSIPTTTLTVTDRIIIQFYITNTNGKTVTLYTQNGYVGEVHTTFTTGIGSLNGLTAPTQYFATGTSGTDFAISSSTATHTFNLPTASGSNRGALSSADWTTFNGKVGGSGTTNYVSKFTGSGTIGNSQIFDNGTNVGIGTTSPTSYTNFTTLSINNATAGGLIDLLQNGTSNFRILTSTTSNMLNGVGNIPMVFHTNGTEKMRITAAGRLLLGTTTESTYLLDVNGTARVSGSVGFGGSNPDGTYNFNSTGLFRFVNSSAFFGNSGGNIVSNNNGAYINNNTSNFTFLGQVNGTNTGNFTGTSSLVSLIAITNIPLGFFTNNTERARIFANGNFAIGTTTDAGEKVYINAGSVGSMRIENSGTNASILIRNSTYPFVRFDRSGTIARSFGIFNASGDIAIQESATWSGSNYHIFFGLGGYATSGTGLFGSNGTINASAILEATSTTKGFLPPRMTGAQAEAIATPAAGLLVYANNGNGTTITSTGWWGYDGTNWVKLN